MTDVRFTSCKTGDDFRLLLMLMLFVLSQGEKEIMKSYKRGPAKIFADK